MGHIWFFVDDKSALEYSSSPCVLNVVELTLQKHLPTYVKKYDDLKKRGVEVIACVSVNDPFV